MINKLLIFLSIFFGLSANGAEVTSNGNSDSDTVVLDKALLAAFTIPFKELCFKKWKDEHFWERRREKGEDWYIGWDSKDIYNSNEFSAEIMSDLIQKCQNKKAYSKHVDKNTSIYIDCHDLETLIGDVQKNGRLLTIASWRGWFNGAYEQKVKLPLEARHKLEQLRVNISQR